MIDTIFIDLGDTLRVIRKDAAYSRAAKADICRLLGVDAEPEAYYRDVIEPRYNKYRDWALTFYCEAPVKILWTRWLAYDLPRERVEAHADALTWAYRKTKGERVVTDGGIDTVKALHARGYTLGIVSDLVGVEEVDDWLDRDGLRPYFKTAPENTCYVGDNLNRDIIGAKAAGLGMTVAVQYPDKKPQTITDENRPDHIITHFSQLLDLFPALN